MPNSKKERYERLNLPDDGEGDASQYGNPTMTEAPWHGYDTSWRVVSNMNEAAVGTVFTFGGQNMQLVQNEHRRAIGVQNTHTGRVRYVPMDIECIGSNDIRVEVNLGNYREAGIASWKTPLGHVLQKESARAPVYSVDTQIRARGGDASTRSSFKFPHIGIHRDLRTNKSIVG